MPTMLDQPLVPINLQREEGLMSNRNLGFSSADDVGTPPCCTQVCRFFPHVKLCRKLSDFQARLGILQPKTSNMHCVSVQSNLDPAGTVGYLKCLIADPIGWAHALHKSLLGLAGFHGKLWPKIVLWMNNSSLLNDSLPKVPGKRIVWETEKEFKHVKKCPVVHLWRENLSKIIIQKQINNTGIVLNNEVCLTWISWSEDMKHKC